VSIECIQSPIFRFWLSTLRDGKGKGLIVARIDRLKEGLAGDTKQLGHGISELRIHYGPGRYFDTSSVWRAKSESKA